jgi:hypothetical protein
MVSLDTRSRARERFVRLAGVDARALVSNPTRQRAVQRSCMNEWDRRTPHVPPHKNEKSCMKRTSETPQLLKIEHIIEKPRAGIVVAMSTAEMASRAGTRVSTTPLCPHESKDTSLFYTLTQSQRAPHHHITSAKGGFVTLSDIFCARVHSASTHSSSSVCRTHHGTSSLMAVASSRVRQTLPNSTPCCAHLARERTRVIQTDIAAVPKLPCHVASEPAAHMHARG